MPCDKAQRLIIKKSPTSQRGLLFSEQEAATSDSSPLWLAFSVTHFSPNLPLPLMGPSSCSENISPEPHHAIFPGHPWSVAEVHQRAPAQFTIFCFIIFPLFVSFSRTSHILKCREAGELIFGFHAD
jgi:hypothetical protein